MCAPVVAIAALGSAVSAFDARNVLGNRETSWGGSKIFEAGDATFVGCYTYKNTPARICGVRTGEGVFDGFWVQEMSEVV